MAVKLKDLIKIIEAAAPLELMESWDNTGLAIGDPEVLIERALIGMDVTEELIQEAHAMGANLILTHHPMLFNRPNSITPVNAQGRRILSLIRNGINVYSIHTNLDKAKGGLNDNIMELLGFSGFLPLEDGTEEGIGRIAAIEATTLMELVKAVSAKLGAPDIRYCGEPGQSIRKVAVINGGGADYIMAAREAGADCVITGDTKYHEVLDALAEGVAVIDPGHFASEWPIFKMTLDGIHLKILKELGNVEFVYSDSASDPYRLFRG